MTSNAHTRRDAIAGSGGLDATSALVAAAADAILSQCAAFVDGVPDEAYCVDSMTLRGGTCGKHVRHVLDHFNAIFLGVETGEAIMYDRRERNVPMETSRAAARATIEELRARLRAGARPDFSGTVRVRVMLAGDGTEAELASTLGRELAFATHHAVHHHAMMKAIAQELGVETGADFGKAPSTINHEGKPVVKAIGKPA